MEKKGILDRFKKLSKPTGSPQWGRAVRAVILMVLAGAIAYFLGLDNGIKAAMVITLLATFIIDIALPIRKVFVLALIGLFMAALAYISASIALSSLTLFILFTIIWAFFTFSFYIFGNTIGFLGFIFFANYFLAVLIVNNKSTTLDWFIYCLLAYLVVSILFIPKLWLEKKRIREMVVVGFYPQTSLENVLSTCGILSGVHLDYHKIEIFKLGSYLKGFRDYCNLIIPTLSKELQSPFKKILNSVDENSLKIGQNFINSRGKTDLKHFDQEFSEIEQKSLKADDNNVNALLDILHNMNEILHRANNILSLKDSIPDTRKLEADKRSFKDVIAANFNLKNIYIRHAIRFTLAITIGLVVVYLTHNRDAIWITMGILIIIKPDVTSTIDNMILRLGFNLIAIIMAILLSFIFPHAMLLGFAFIMLFLFRAFFPNYMGLSVMALTVFIVFIWPTGTVFDNAIARIIDITIGAIISFICAYVILPNRVTINLPGQVVKTIKANSEYAKQVLISKNQEYNHEIAFKAFKNYILEENNLEAGIKKIQDSFKDIDSDLAIYQGIKSANNKLAADLSAVATILEKEDVEFDFSSFGLKVHENLDNLCESIDKNKKFKKLFLYNLQMNMEHNALEQYLYWVNSDLKLLYNGLKIANETGLLSKYKKLD